ncbi:unnamed protein product [Rhizoctonia solani]|uniref:BTB domain-containing protein n=1 Tax=Rhizoctonia solani TaxID=456999 RepID=A0A8H3DBN1_9AGAM|nr:unnamed protein product [Rhizoctonia solani]
MPLEEMYQVVVEGEVFRLTRSQIEFDSPNYFTTSLLGDFRESDTRRLDIPRHPGLFKIIMRYLSGYEVLPLSYSLIPKDMSSQAALANLRVDADFYQLDGLILAIDALDVPCVATMKLGERYLAFLGTYNPIHHPEYPAKVISGVISTEWSVTSLPPGRQLNPPFNNLKSPESATTFDELHVLAAVQGVLKGKLGERYRNHWRLVGYKTVLAQTPARYQNTILVERVLQSTP